MDVKVEVKGLLVDFVRALNSGQILIPGVPLPPEIQGLLDFTQQLDMWLDKFIDKVVAIQTAVQNVQSEDACRRWEGITFFGEKLIDLIPDFR